MLARQLHFGLLAAIFGLVVPQAGLAQHDPHRNAVRHIAAAKWTQFEKEIDKADEKDPETQFVRALAALMQDDLAAAERHAAAALEAGMLLDRFEAGPLPALKKLQARPAYRKWKSDHKPSPLLHGPMLGNLTSEGAHVWLRTASPAKVSVDLLDESGKVIAQVKGETTASSDRTTVLKVAGLQADSSYRYLLEIDGQRIQQDSFRLKTPPATRSPIRVRVGMGGGAGFVPKWERMWDTILATKPDALLMLGDNVYIDDPKTRLTSDYCYYRRQSRPEWRRLTAQTPTYSIYDDHDFGTNDCVPGPEIESPTWKRKVWNEFKTNWANPAYGGGEEQPGCWYDFYLGDVHFILLDGRYYRTRGKQPTMLGPVQRKWLESTLRQSKGVFKVVTSPVPWSQGVKPGSKDPWDGFPKEREEIFRFIEDNKIEGVVLAAGRSPPLGPENHEARERLPALRIRKFQTDESTYAQSRRNAGAGLGLQQEVLIRPDAL